jgi:hypothetical protein
VEQDDRGRVGRAGLGVADAQEACIICLTPPNEATIPAAVVVSAVRIWLSVLIVDYRSAGLTARAALTMRSATAAAGAAR